MDGCSVNTGIHTGAMRIVEIEIGNVVQHVVCGLHLNELVFWHVLLSVDGVTKGPDSLSGPIGSTLTVVSFKALTSKVPVLPDTVVEDLSRDQLLAYRYAFAIKTGAMPEDLVGQTIGPMVTSRWITTGTRILCKYTRTSRPSKHLVKLVQLVLNVYLPGFFLFKCSPHIQMGALNFFQLLELTRDLDKNEMIIAQNVLQDNSYWAHTENIVIALLADEREEIRRMGVLRIMKARREFDVSNHPRKFIPPKVDFKAKNYFDMVDWNSEPCTEPPLTMEYSAKEIFLIIQITPEQLNKW